LLSRPPLLCKEGNALACDSFTPSRTAAKVRFGIF
jgi:hypothetical protein